MISSQSTAEQFINRVAMKIRIKRDTSGVSQKEAAHKLNIGHRTYQRIENAEMPCDLLFLQRFSLAFDMDFLELVTPYAPRMSNFTLYVNEQKPLEKHPFVQQKKFLELCHKFEKEDMSLAKNPKFTNFDSSLVLWSQSKRMYNGHFRETFQMVKGTNAVILPRAEERINFFDCLHFHRPKYTVKTLNEHFVNGQRLNLEIFSTHIYQEKDIYGLSLVKSSPVL